MRKEPPMILVEDTKYQWPMEWYANKLPPDPLFPDVEVWRIGDQFFGTCEIFSDENTK